MNADSRHVWAILVNHAGAYDDDSNWVNFRQWFDRAIEGRGDEYRFGGSLGFGGKFWLNRGEMYVTCYPEDRTPERDAIIAKVNELLAGASA